MKVVMLHKRNFPPEPRMQNEAEILINMGLEVHMICLNNTEGLSKEENYRGIKIQRVNISNLTYKLSALAYSFPFFHKIIKPEIFKILDKIKPDVLHLHNMDLAPVVFEYKQKYDLPLVFDVHENIPEIMKFYPHLKSRLNKILINLDNWKKAEKKYLKESDYNIVVAKEATEYYERNFNIERNKFVEVSNTVTDSFYTSPKLESAIADKYKENFTLLYLGDTGERRGLLTAIESLKVLKSKIKNLKLLIVGKSNFDTTLKDYASKNNLSSYIDFAGWQDFSLFPSFIKASKIGICPLHRNIHHDTTFANKIFQYLAFGLPIVVSDCPPQKRIAETYAVGKVHLAEDSDSFAKAILEIYENEALYDEYSQNAVAAIKNSLSFNEMNKGFLNLYKNLIAKYNK